MAFVLPSCASAAAVTWVSSPVLPNETALVSATSGAGFSNSSKLELCDIGTNPTHCELLELLQPWDRGTKFVVPAARPLRVWSLRNSTDTFKRELARLRGRGEDFA